MVLAYGDDLAFIHGVGFGGFATESAPGLLEILRRNGIVSGRVVDLGCGSGLWAAELCRAGYEVFGVDISAAMLKLARKRAPQARFRRASYLKVNLPRCEAVTSLGECLSYRIDKNVGLEQLGRLFKRVHAALRPGGLLIFDIREPRRTRGVYPQMVHAAGKDWAVLMRARVDATGRELTRRITSFRKVGRFYRRSEEVHHLRLYRRSEVTAALRRVGFKVRTVRRYGQRRFVGGHVGFVARKA